MLEEVMKALLGAAAATVVTWLVSKVPAVRTWLSQNSPSYLVVVAAALSALLVAIGFIVYLDILRRQEIAFLKDAGDAVSAAVNESRIAKNQGSHHAVFALDWSEKTQKKISDRMDYRIGSFAP